MRNDCADGEMRDLLPDYVHGTLSAARHATVAAHLEVCADCAAEVELIATALRAFPAPKIDVARITRALPKAPQRTGRNGFTVHVWRVAAAIGIIAIGAFSVIALRGVFSAAQRQVATTPAQAARSTVAAAIPAPAAVDSPVHAALPAVSRKPAAPSISFGGGLSDLTDDQLDALLGELDGLEALPSAEPETHLTPIVPDPDGGHSAR